VDVARARAAGARVDDPAGIGRERESREPDRLAERLGVGAEDVARLVRAATKPPVNVIAGFDRFENW
jgi:hypothetical protein